MKAFRIASSWPTYRCIPKPITFEAIRRISTANSPITMASQASSSSQPDSDGDVKAAALFSKISARFPSETLGEDRWYIPTLSAMAYVEPEHAAYLYKYLISQPSYATPSARQGLVKRLREVLLEMTSLIGVVKTLEGVFSIAAVEKEEDRDYSFSRYVHHPFEKTHCVRYSA